MNEKSLERYLESLLSDQKRLCLLYEEWAFLRYSVVDPDPNWIRVRDLCGFGSVFRIRIRIQTGK